jgi:hypothetical protein
MKISDAIARGPIPYTHAYNSTMTSVETAEHILDVPKALRTIGADHPDAEMVVYGDDSLGIEIGGNIWAVEQPHPEREGGRGVRLPSEVWQYLRLAVEPAQG